MAPTYNDADSRLINDLHYLVSANDKGGGRRKLVRTSRYDAPADPFIKIESWKMDEFKYYAIPSPFPTLARGLFSTPLEGTTEDGTPRHCIVARGYDKFFNIGEVPWTTWDALERETCAPYTLTLKSNGCIVFIAPLSPDKLIVCSKHSLGPIEGVQESHAQAGERWLEAHLARVGRTKADLAQTLWEKNWTAVAELCDDEFEEHVLPYSRDKSGLHLHGLNASTGAFLTQPQLVVDAFAREWGFIVTASTELSSIADVRSFTDAIAQTGRWNGEPVEGFVVRTTVVDSPAGPGTSPYAPGSSFFFKIKFDEPYMMYRDWREVTRTLLAARGTLDAVSLPKSKMRRVETRLYVKWVIGEIQRDRSQFDGFAKGRGIIATRERFLEWMKAREGAEAAAESTESEDAVEDKKFGKTIIVPVAVPGVGKTAIAVALSHLFGFAHTQSDDVRARKAAPQFIKNVVRLLKDHDVVIADKNNHLRQHREQLRAAVQAFSPPVQLLALVWPLDSRPQATIHRLCADRVLARGTNHQTLHGDAAARAHEDVIWKFLHQAEELGEHEVDAMIEMDVTEDLEDALDRAVDGVVRALGLPRPTREQVGEALAAVRGYTPASIDAQAPKATPVRYFGLLTELNIPDVLGTALAAPDAPKMTHAFWAALEEAGRVTLRPHATLVHSRSLDAPYERELWARCEGLHTASEPPMFSARLSRVLCDGRVLVLPVEELRVDDPAADEDQRGAQFVSLLPACVRERLHITVGTRSVDIAPVEAMALVERWRRGETEGIEEALLGEVWVRGRVKGLRA
ncbi:RNA ligase-domain-containing protein [Vararia minispora EC-137]|uniref:RNA ligase-domain-containing protein n=1 Tax=Vararia minispora EC-137 TaxID=1314806 RepID=A0ACB8QEQ3_9AGAM|nr:RNA ligase-domain-containing protein [Vararia minispora EC-137]